MRNTLFVVLLATIFSFSQDATPAPVLEKSPFPIEGSVNSIKKHGDDQLAVSIAIYNDSPRLVKGFIGLFQFIVKGAIVSEVTLEISKDLPAEENTLWYGAIPFDAGNSKHIALREEGIDNVDDIEVHIVVKSFTNNNGVQTVFSN